METECISGSLITQGMLNGYIAQEIGKIAIIGASRQGGAIMHGFPTPWEVAKSRSDKFVLGWKKDDADMGGKVVILSNARPAGE